MSIIYKKRNSLPFDVVGFGSLENPKETLISAGNYE